MMHELKTPIAKGMIIAETIPDDFQDKAMLQRAFERMNNIIKELATVERVSSNTLTVHKSTHKFEELYQHTLEILMTNDNLIHTNIKDFELTVDHSLFIIVLKNLLDNG
ncbi:MAG: HAMP domain-containing histidine kinase, partial [Lentisphaeraceae bacterium]|nr:HAMP domain-containing histidine kinase [Lentisphaeraceae bacterium]